MGSPTPPKPVRLVLADFPQEPWARSLVEAFNQLALQTTQALTGVGGQTKLLNIAVNQAYPIDVPVTAPVTSARVAMVLSGTPTGAVTVLAQQLSGGRLLRISNITGLSASSTYSLRLALE